MEEKKMPLIGEKFPNIEARTTHGKISLPGDYRGKWFVLFSHPGDFTPVCTTEFYSFQKKYEYFKGLDCELIGLSVDQIFSHIKWIEWIGYNLGVEIKFPIIADELGKISESLNMIHPKKGANSVRAVFIVDNIGFIRTILYYPQELGRNIDEILRILKSLQISDQKNLAIPANWPNNELIGSKGIIPPAKDEKTAKERLIQSKKGEIEGKDWWFCYKKVFDEEDYELEQEKLKPSVYYLEEEKEEQTREENSNQERLAKKEDFLKKDLDKEVSSEIKEDYKKNQEFECLKTYQKEVEKGFKDSYKKEDFLGDKQNNIISKKPEENSEEKINREGFMEIEGEKSPRKSENFLEKYEIDRELENNLIDKREDEKNLYNELEKNNLNNNLQKKDLKKYSLDYGLRKENLKKDFEKENQDKGFEEGLKKEDLGRESLFERDFEDDLEENYGEDLAEDIGDDAEDDLEEREKDFYDYKYKRHNPEKTKDLEEETFYG